MWNGSGLTSSDMYSLRIIPQTFVSFLRHLHNTCWHKMVIIMASLSLSLCVAVVVIIPLLSTIVFVGLLDFGHHHCLFVLLLSSSHCHCKMVIVMVLSSLSLCVAAVVIIHLLSTIVFVGLLDFGHCCHLFVLLSSHHCFCCCCCCCLFWVIVIVALCCCCHCRPLIVNHYSCWIIGLLVYWIVGLFCRRRFCI